MPAGASARPPPSPWPSSLRLAAGVRRAAGSTKQSRSEQSRVARMDCRASALPSSSDAALRMHATSEVRTPATKSRNAGALRLAPHSTQERTSPAGVKVWAGAGSPAASLASVIKDVTSRQTKTKVETRPGRLSRTSWNDSAVKLSATAAAAKLAPGPATIARGFQTPTCVTLPPRRACRRAGRLAD